ncbi:MAG: hypothetical protein ACE5H3_04810 [Planctomycetota bacterium]
MSADREEAPRRPLVALLVLLLLPACRGFVGNPAMPSLEFRVVAGPASPETGPADRLDVKGQDLELGPAHKFHVPKARLTADEEGNPGLAFEIAGKEQEDFRAWTESIVGKRLAILLDGRVLSLATVQMPLVGKGILFPNFDKPFSKKEIEALVRELGGP